MTMMTSKLQKLVILVCSVTSSFSVIVREDQPVVHVPDFGTIYGETLPFKHDYPPVDKTINAFKGIPFAQNASHYRFMKPEPLLALEGGELNAITYSSICWQLPEVFENDHQSEDCLYLNIWTPNPKPQNAHVLVWFHGGAFVMGSGSEPNYEGHALVGYHDLVYVSVNYRLNGYGFMSTGDDALPGMYGMFDQLEALKWINRNIHAFGGDPDEVAIFGQSAGGGSVGLHLLSPYSGQYFKRAMPISGVGTSPWAVETDAEKAREDAFKVGQAARCPDLSTSEKLAECLRGLDEKTLTLAIDRVLLETTNIIPLVPTVDGDFLPDQPLALLEANQFKKCPVLLGSTKDDGTLVAARAFIRQLFVEEPYANSSLFRESLEKYTYTYKNDAIVDAIIHEYVDWTLADDPDANYFYTYVELETDEAFACPADGWARAYAESGEDVYLYQFTHLPNASVWNEPEGYEIPWKGVAHSEDEQFIFGYYYNPNLDEFHGMPQDEIEFTVDMMRYYTNFAKTGNPNLDHVGGQPDTSAKAWPKFTIPALDYKILDPDLKDGRALRARRCNFWNEYLPQLVNQAMDMSDVEQEWREDYSRWKNQDMVAWYEAFDDYQSNTEPCT